MDVEIIDDIQYVKGKQKLGSPNIVCVFVQLADDEKDDFYIFQLKDLQEYFSKSYQGGRRSKNPKSLHCAILPKDLQQHRNNWSLIEKSLRSA